ncbi:tyrosine-type recombinase/integrase [Methylorubrum extorquens]|uniref:tyrosine-type recombinase/integrase n=1 Tax=Methylorubrum extorquens TaxID=408 RepID=UPI001EE4F4BC|nr:site-specific integrase [Methylorubrum extorquens]MCG5245302.1 site-specific integrase [Methylorubrum extorquens]
MKHATGQTKRETLGKVGVLSTTDARRAAAERLARVRLGAEREAERKRAAVIVASKIPAYLDALTPRVRAKGLEESAYHMQKAWAPLHKTPVDGVTRAQVAERLSEIAKGSGPHTANQARTTLSSFFTWLIAEGAAEANPVVGTRKPIKEGRRQRVLKPEEIKAVLKALPEGDFGRIVRLTLPIAQRRDRVAKLPWSEINLAAGIWHLPKERTENGLPHDVPLSHAVLSILSDAPRIEGRDLVFGSGVSGFQGFTGRSGPANRPRWPASRTWRDHRRRR